MPLQNSTGPDEQQPYDPLNPGPANLENGWPFDPAKNVARARQAVASGDPHQIYEAARGLVGSGYTIDPETGQVRETTWWEEHGDTTMFLATAAGSLFGAYYLASLGAGGSASTPAGSSSLNNAWSGGGDLVGSGEAGVSSTPFAAGAAGGPAATGTIAGGTGPAAASVGKDRLASQLLKYGVPAAEGAVDSYLSQKNADANRNIAQEQVAVNQSNLDPWRQKMFQTSDVATLEQAQNPPKVYGPAAGSPYAGASDPNGGYKGFTPSATFMNTMRNAQGDIAAGRGTMPNMMDPSNWGQTGVTDLSQPPPATSAPASPGTTPPAGPGTMAQDPNAAPASLSSLLARRYGYGANRRPRLSL